MMMLVDDEEEVTFDQSTLLTNRLKPQSRRKWCMKLFKTLGVSLAFLALGLCIAIPGPTLLDLMERVMTDTQHIAYIFTARSVGYLVGSVLGGFLFDRFDQQLLLCMILFFTSIATAAAPWCQTLIALAVMISFQGISMGFLDTGGNIYCIQIWGKNSGPYMQTLHFCFGVGAFIAPLLAKPFLSAVALHPSTNISGSSTLLQVQVGNIPLVMPQYGQPDTEDDHRDPRDLFPDFKLSVHRREIDGNLTAFNDSNETSILTTTTSITTTTLIQNKQPVPRKPNVASDKSLKDETAADDPTAHIKKQVDAEQPRTSTSTPSPTVPPPEVLTKAVTLVPNQTLDLGNSTLTETVVTVALNTSSTTKATTVTPTAVTPSATTTVPTTSTVITTTSTTTATTVSKSVPVPVSTPPESATATGTIAPTLTSVDNTSIAIPQQTPSNVTSSPSPTTPQSHKPSKTVGEFMQNTLDALKHMSTIQFAYLIIAVVLLLSSLLFMALYCWDKRESVLTGLGQDEDRGEITESRGFRFQMLTLLFIFYFMYVGMEVTYGGFIMTFAVKAFHWSKDRGTIVTAIFWGALAAGRGIAIFVAKCCRPSVMLIIYLVLTLVASLILSFGVNHYHDLLWPGTLLFGLGLSAIFPTGLSWAERYMKLTGKATAVMVVGSALGEMCVPAMTGYFFQTMDLMSLMYIMLALSTVASVLFVIMQNLASNRGDRYSVSKFLQLDEGESMEMVNQGEDVEIFNSENKPTKRKKVKFNLDSNGTSYKPLRSSEEE